jgi:mRNA interferase MazF
VIPRQGEIWWAEAEDKRRPVLVVTRSDVIDVLHWVVVAPVTRTVRHIRTEVLLDERNGLHTECAASFDNLQPIRRGFLSTRIGKLDVEQGRAICEALEALADC